MKKENLNWWQKSKSKSLNSTSLEKMLDLQQLDLQRKIKTLVRIVKKNGRNRMITIEQNIQTCGLVTELTKSQTENFDLIQKHWATFNDELKKWKLIQNGGNWTKYGITYKTAEKYFYLTAIPTYNNLFPDHFTSLEIPKGEYEIFTHKGKMENIKQTIFEIYKVILPKSNLKIENDIKTGFIHFEKYDYRFQWNKPTSIIDIYLPINTNK